MDENAEDAPAKPPRPRLRWLILAAVLVIAAGATTVFLVTRGDDEVAAARPWVPPANESPFADDEYGEPEIKEHCLDPGGKQTVIVYFDGDDPDPVMREAAAALEGDDRIVSVLPETRQEAYERFRKIFAEQPELVRLARPESLPASVTLLPADGVYPGDLADFITAELPEIDSLGAGCEYAK